MFFKNSLRILFLTILLFTTAILFLVTTCASADTWHKHRDVRAAGYRRGQEQEKIEFLLNEIFERSIFPLDCLRKKQKRANAKECMTELEVWSEGTSPYDCKFFQVEYDCLVVTTRGCSGREIVLLNFLEIQRELGAKYGCTVEQDIDLNTQNPSEGDDYKRALNITTPTTTATTTTTTPRPTNDNSTRSPIMRRRLKGRSRSQSRSRAQQKNMNYTENSNSAPLRILGNMVSFIFTWIPRSLYFIVSDEGHCD